MLCFSMAKTKRPFGAFAKGTNFTVKIRGTTHIPEQIGHFDSGHYNP